MEEQEVTIQSGTAKLSGLLYVPKQARAIVLFAHGSGSSRFSPRNNFVAKMMQESGLATLLMDLLTEEEESVDLQTAEYRFDIPLMAMRVVGAANWLAQETITKDLKQMFIGSSTGAAAAIIAAVNSSHPCWAVVSRGGRPDLAREALAKLSSPILLIIGAKDEQVIRLNEEAYHKIVQAEKKMILVPGATHLFEEEGTLEQASMHARQWFLDHI